MKRKISDRNDIDTKKNQPHFKTTSQKTDGDNTLIKGMLTCCNIHEFEVYAAGEMKHGMFSKMYLISKEDKIALAVHCKKCGKVISVFDSGCDGYEQCGKKYNTQMPTKPIVCKKCLDNNFSVSIKYEYPNAQELKDLAITETDNAYTWIWITIVCNKCGTEYRNFVDYETS